MILVVLSLRRSFNAFVFYCVEWYFLIANPFFFGLLLFAAGRLSLERRLGPEARLRVILERIYYCGHTAAMVVVSGVFFRASPATVALSWAAWRLSLILAARSDLFYSIYVKVFFIASFAFLASLEIPMLTWAYGAMALAMVFSRPDVERFLPRPEFKAVALRGIFALMLSLHFFWFYIGRSGAGVERVESRPGVSFIFSFKRDAAVGKNIGEYLRFVKEDCESENIYFGGIEFLWFDKRPNRIMRYNKRTGKIFDTGWNIDSSYVVDMDCERDMLYVGRFDGPLVEAFRPGEWGGAARRYGAVADDIYDVTLVHGGERFLVWDGGKNLTLFQADKRRVLATQHLKTGVNIAIRPDGRECAVCGRKVISVFSINQNAPYLKLKKRFKINADMYSCIYTSSPGRLIGTGMFGKKIKDIDLKREEVREIRLPHTARNLLLVRPGLVAVSDFFGGRVSFLREESLEVIGSVRVGRRVRNLYLSNDGKKVFFSNALGVGVIDLEEVLGERLKKLPE